MQTAECVVVGAGVIGLAIGRALAMRGLETILLDAESRIGSGISSRSSEVIHAGLYYPPGSLKNIFCIEGRRQLYHFCEARGVPYRRCGKLVVATSPQEIAALETLEASAVANSIDIESLTSAQAQSIEPELRCTAALFSPSTGIIDSHAYMLALQGEAEAHGVLTALGVRLSAITLAGPGLRLSFAGDPDPALEARLVINAAGLGAQAIARMIPETPEGFVPPLHYAKGSYFDLAGRSPFSHLVYPLPSPGGLGVHLTIDMAGRARFGPDVQWVEEPDFHVDPARSAAFYDAIRCYWPALPDGALSPAYAGIRPKLGGAAEPSTDFMIAGPQDHGQPGIINLFGIESPGLTASLAIAAYVARMATNTLN